MVQCSFWTVVICRHAVECRIKDIHQMHAIYNGDQQKWRHGVTTAYPWPESAVCLNHCRLIKTNKHSRCRHDGSATVLQPFSTRGIFCPPCFRGEGNLKCQTPDRQGNRKLLNRGVVVFQHLRAGNMSLNSRTEGSTQAPIRGRLWPKKVPCRSLCPAWYLGYSTINRQKITACGTRALFVVCWFFKSRTFYALCRVPSILDCIGCVFFVLRANLHSLAALRVGFYSCVALMKFAIIAMMYIIHQE